MMKDTIERTQTITFETENKTINKQEEKGSGRSTRTQGIIFNFYFADAVASQEQATYLVGNMDCTRLASASASLWWQPAQK